MKSKKLLNLLNLLTLLVLLTSVLPAAVTAAPPGPHNAEQAPEPRASPRLQVTTEDMNPAVAAPPQPMAPVDLVLDDGTNENTIGVGDGAGAGIQFIWMNRFTPAPGDFPFDLEEIWVNFANVDVPVGGTIDLIVYEDIDGDGDPSNATVVAVYNDVVQFNDGTWSVYTLSPALTLNGPGDVVIAVVNRYMNSGVDPQDHPATLDMTASQGRSWVGWYTTDPPDPPTLPPNAIWGTIDALGFPGNWMIRGYGENANGVGWLEGNVMDAETGGMDPTCTEAIVHIEPGSLDVPADLMTGYYGPTSLISGTYALDALAPGYSVGTAVVDIVTDMTTTQDFGLWRPVIDVAPSDFISITAYISQEATYPLLIVNDGHMPLDFEISEQSLGPLHDPLSKLQSPPGIEVEPELLAQLEADETGDYMIYFRERADLSPAFSMDWYERGQFVVNALQKTANRTQANVRAYLDAQGARYQAFWIDNVIVVESSDRKTFDGLLDFSEIAALRVHRIMQVFEPIDESNPVDPAPMFVEPNISHVNADQVWAMGYQGEGMIVANIDTGVRYTHEALNNQYRGNLGGGSYDHDYDWLDADATDGTSATPFDDHGHGSHTMGIMIGDDAAHVNQIGMAPSAQWIACDGCNTLTGCPGQALLDCAQWVVAPYPIGDPSSPDPDMRPHVVNNSWGNCETSYNSWYQGAVDSWHAAGIYPVFSNGNAGNCGYPEPPGCNTVGNPGRYGNVTSVGSTGQSNGQYADHSNWGPTDNADTVNPNGYPSLKPQVVAPGVNIRSSLNGSDSDYANWGGTSMSAPHVSGLIALMWQAAPCLIGDYATTETLIEQTATPIPYDSGCGGEGPGDVPNHAAGWGEIDALAAVEAAMDYCIAADLAWVWTDPISGTIPDLEQIEIDVTFHCTETRDYEGILHIEHNDPCAPPIDVPIVLHCLEPQQDEWGKWVNGIEWYPGIEFTLETSDTIEVVDVVTTALDFQLFELWNPAELALVDLVFEPPFAPPPQVFPDSILWDVPAGIANVFTLTKLFHVEPCTWLDTVLWEELWIGGVEVEQRPVTIFKLPPILWIDADYEPEVWAGAPATFTLIYGNDGGYENDVMVRNEFPPEAPYLYSVPPADRWAADGSWAEWDVGDLPGDDSGSIDVTVDIDPTLPPSTTIEIWDYVFDHVDQEQDAVLISLHVRSPEWGKWINGVEWYPGIEFTLETSDTLEVVDVVTGFQDFVLLEFWDPAELDLIDFQPSFGDVVIIPGDPFMLEWIVPPGPPEVVTLTKLFHVAPCTWTETILWEELWVAGVEVEQRSVTIFKLEPVLWIDADYEPEVWAGAPATFTLIYGNDGGYENDVMVRNEFPPEAPYLYSVPPADRWAADGSWAEWDVGDLPGDDSGSIDVSVAIDPTLPPSTTIEIWDYVFDHVGQEQDAVLITLHVRSPEWGKWINGVEWYPGIEFTLETSDTIEVVDVITGFQDFVLVEFWDPAELDLIDFQPSFGNVVITPGDPFMLEWIVPPGPPEVVTLTKLFHVAPCTWTETILWEELWVAGVEVEQRSVTIFKLEPVLWIDADYEPEVWAGAPATFTLIYGNDGGFENDVMVRNEFPPEAPFLSSVPPADRWAADGSWAEWDVGDLPGDDSDSIDVSVAISPSLPPSTTIEIWDYVFDHVDQEQDAVLITLHVQPPEWGKWINGVEWYPGIEFTLETSDTIEVVDVVATFQDFVLVEFWDPAELDLIDFQPSFGDVVITPGDPFMLEWIVPPGPPEVVTLTKLFHVEPCTWTETILQEELWVAGVEVEQRPVTIFKLPPILWIDADYEPEVWAGAPATFTLIYGNDGGFENDAMVRNEFPPEAPFLSSVPPADRWAADGSWAEWDVGDLPGDDGGSIDVSVAISDTLEPCTWITITDRIYDHVGDVADVVTITLHVTEPSCIELTGITIFGDTDGEPGIYTFTTAYQPTNATPPITYLWDNGDTTDTSIRALTVGTHTLTVEATNCDDVSVSGTHTIVITTPAVCTDVTDVDLTVLTPTPIHPGDPVDLSADIIPDDASKPYNYRLAVDGTPGSVMASIADPLTFTQTFTITGIHTIGIAVWNCGMSEDEAVVDDVTINVVGEEEGHYIYLPIILKNHGP